MRQEVRFEQLNEIGMGAVTAIMNDELRKAVRDIAERQQLGKARTVQLTVTLEPKMGKQSGVVESVVMSADCHAKLPKQQTDDFHTTLDASGKLIYNDLDGGNVRQRTLDEVEVDRDTGEEITQG